MTAAARQYQNSDALDNALPHDRAAAVLLALMPFVSFAAQYALSRSAGTLPILHRHLTVMVVDWVFVPFNYYVVRAIDWSRGARMFLIWCVSIVLNLLTIAIWQRTGADFGHMIDVRGVVLGAGWVHLGFAVIETFLLIAFVFCRQAAARTGVASALACVYFLTMGACGFWMHHGFIASDLCAAGFGLFFVLVFPKIASRRHT